MQRSEDQILVTHVGSLPRSDALMKFLIARDTKQDYDEAAFRGCLKQSIKDVVHKQVEYGIDIVNDGELGKIGYGAYAKERLSGFGGQDAPKLSASDLDEFPVYYRRLYGPEGFDKMVRPQCTGPIAYIGHADLAFDIETLKEAMIGAGAAGGFLNAASPGAIGLWLGNAITRRMSNSSGPSPRPCRPNTRRSPPPALSCRSMRPTSAWGGTCNSAISVCRSTAKRQKCTLPRSTTPRAISRRSACGCTCAGAITMAPTTTTSSSRT